MPQMSPLMWLVFPVVVMTLNMFVMMINSSDKVEIESGVMMNLGVGELWW